MEYNYIYIDDESQERISGTINGLKESNKLNIIFENPLGNWEKQRENLISRQDKFHGLIIDLKLEEHQNAQKEHSYYKGTTLAQELRTLSKEGIFADIPIILLSATANITSSFDSTGFDLFDLIIHKDKLNAEDYPNRRKQLYSLAKGYLKLKSLTDETTPEKLFDIFGPEINNADVRFQQKVITLFDKTTHEFVRFLLREFIEKDGILICEQTLAARLGVDYLSSPDWKTIIEDFEPYLYKGLLKEGWKLWWASGIEQWWSEVLNESSDIRYMNSEERVSIIKAKTNFKSIEPIIKNNFSNSTLFWHICSKTGLPIDPIDSILASGQDNLFPWQDRLYVSLEQALHGPKSDLSPLEWERVEKLKTYYSRERVRRE